MSNSTRKSTPSLPSIPSKLIVPRSDGQQKLEAHREKGRTYLSWPKFLRLIALLVLLATLPLSVYLTQHTAGATGNTYYVSKNGSNGDALSWTTAWSDLDQINWDVINPGDTIVIDGGSTSCPSNYDFVATRPGISCGMLYNSTLTVRKSGTATAPITITLATDVGHNGTAVFFGGRATPLPYCGQTSYTPQTVGTGLRVGISIGAYQNVVLDGGKRSGFMLYGYDDPTNNRVNGDGLGIQFTSSSASNITIRNMEIFDNGVYDTISKSSSPLNGTYNSDSKGIEPVGSNLTFERLLIHDNGQDDFQSGGPLANLTIQDSWIFERRSNPLYPGFSFNSAPHLLGCTHVDGIQVYGGGVQSGMTFTNDVFGPMLGQGIYPSDTGTYFNNVSMNNVLLIDATENNVNSDPQSSGGPQNWTMQNVTAYQVPGGAEPGWNTNLGVYSGTGSLSLTNSIVVNGNVQLPGFTGSGNINYNSDPVPGSTIMNPQFTGLLQSNNTPDYNTLASTDFTPTCASCAGKGSSLHTIQDILTDIDMLNAANFPILTPPPTLTPTSTQISSTIFSASAASGTITAPFAVGTDTDGTYVAQTTNTFWRGPTAGGEADYTFTVPTAGTYTVGAIVNAPDLASNSLYVNIDTEPTGRTMIWDIPITSGYQFQVVSWRGNGTADADQFIPQVFTLTAGTHTLILRGREANTRFSQVSVQIAQDLRIMGEKRHSG